MSTHIRIGPEQGRLLLRTGRKGLAAQAGHDLTIEVARWSGEVELAEDVTASSLGVTADLGSLRVVEGKGGAIPLSERDKREIAATARKILNTDRQPEARFTATKISGDTGGGTVEGTLSMLGQDHPLTLTVGHPGENRFRATGTVIQSEYGIKPYTAMLGALKLADPVGVEVEVTVEVAP